MAPSLQLGHDPLGYRDPPIQRLEQIQQPQPVKVEYW